jgi:hypothetical protein
MTLGKKEVGRERNPIPYEGARKTFVIESLALELLEMNVSPLEVVELSRPDISC